MANGGNGFLAQQRAPLFAELAQKPWLVNWLASIGESENSGKPLGILESLFNRAAWSGKSLESLVKSDFYGPRTVRRLQSDTSGAGTLSPKALANAKTALDQIKAGSNVTQGSVDQGQVNEIKSPFKISVDGEYFGDMGNSAAWRQQQQAAAAKAGPAPATTGAATPATQAATSPATSPAPSTPSPSSTVTPAGTAAPGMYARGGTLPSDLPGRSLAGVTPVLRELLGGAKTEFEKANPGYTVVATSGARPGGPSSSQHAGGNAIDMQIVGPNGQAIANTGNDPSGLYHQYARYVYAEQQANHPELNGKLAWGGAFGTELGGGGPPDLMHFDLGRERGHWTMNRPSQMGGLPLQLANATGAGKMADQTQTQPSGGYGPPVPPGNIVQNGQMYAPVRSGTGNAYQPMGTKKGGRMGSTAMGQQGGAPYIPILSEIGSMFFGTPYPGRPASMTSYAPQQAAAPASVPAGPPQRWNPATKNWDTGVGPSVPSNVTPATGNTGPTPGTMPPWPTTATAPTPNTPMARIPGILPGASAPLPPGVLQSAPSASSALRNVLNAVNPVSSANAAPAPSAQAAIAQTQPPGGSSAAGLPQAASFAERFSAAPGQPGTGGPNIPLPRANPIAGQQTSLIIPPRGPWPPAPPRTPQQAPGMTIAGIPLPRPRPQMPANPPVQIPQPQQPAQPPQPSPSRAAMPLPGAPGVPMPTPPIARTNATPGPLGGTPMPPGAARGVRFLDTVPPQSTSQGGPVPPPTPSQTASPAQILADQAHNSPAFGMVPTSSGDAGAPLMSAFAARFPQAPAPGPTSSDAINQALLDYLRRQQGTGTANSNVADSYSGAY